jgi:hypothetical protein
VVPGLLWNQPVVRNLLILHSDPSGFPKLICGPQFFQFGPKFRKIFTKRSLASEKSPKISPNFKNSYLFNHNSKSSDSYAKILRSTSSFFLCIHITHVCFILLIDCMYLLHGRKRCAGTIVWGSSRPSFWGVLAVLHGSTRQVSLNMLHLWLISLSIL